MADGDFKMPAAIASIGCLTPFSFKAGLIISESAPFFSLTLLSLSAAACFRKDSLPSFYF